MNARHDRRQSQQIARRTLLSLGIATLFAACHRDLPTGARPRCSFCGMRVPAGSHWEAGGTGADGAVLSFDTPGCLFRYARSARGAGLRDPWVTEYYGAAGVHTPARALRYVVGSDVIGPMGPDLVPVEPSRIQGFTHDHHGTSDLAFDAVTDAVLHAL